MGKNTTTAAKQNYNLKPLPEPEIEPGSSSTQSGCVTSALRSQLRVTIVVKLFNCFSAMGRNVNKQRSIAGHTRGIFFCNIFTCMDIYIWQFLKFTEVGFNDNHSIMVKM